MALATTQGKKVALAALAKRRKANKTKKHIDNGSLPAGSPMYFYCDGCDADIIVPEDYIIRPRLCSECKALKDLGWLE